MIKIGILHPGEMGISIAASLMNSGHQAYWVSEGRSPNTRARAVQHKVAEVNTLTRLCEICETIISICPPHAAEDVAHSVVEANFKGLYLDANAISPERAAQISEVMQKHGIRFVDGGIIGGPAWTSKETWLYLSGEHAHELAACFSKGPLETKIIGTEVGKASALKMCYAAYTKGTTALLAAILATSESLGVREELYERWNMDEDEFSEQVNQRIKRVTAKAWRFEGEMNEIAMTFQGAGLPQGFHLAAAEIYHRLASFKNAGGTPHLEDVLNALLL